jgi:DNA replication protein DnaC
MSFRAAAPTIPKNDLAAQLAQIGLLGLAETLDDFLARATKARLSHRQLVEELVRLETTEGAKRSLARRLARSRIGRFKPLTDFDWNWPKHIERDVIERLMTLDFIQDNCNVVLMGSNGLGKTMLARNVGYQAAVAGYSVLFTTAAELIDDLRAESLTQRSAASFTSTARPNSLSSTRWAISPTTRRPLISSTRSLIAGTSGDRRSSPPISPSRTGTPSSRTRPRSPRCSTS